MNDARKFSMVTQLGDLYLDSKVLEPKGMLEMVTTTVQAIVDRAIQPVAFEFSVTMIANGEPTKLSIFLEPGPTKNTLREYFQSLDRSKKYVMWWSAGMKREDGSSQFGDEIDVGRENGFDVSSLLRICEAISTKCLGARYWMDVEGYRLYEALEDTFPRWYVAVKVEEFKNAE